MRLTTYKQAVDSAMKLPDSLKLPNKYISPRDLVLNEVMMNTRVDANLYVSEVAELFSYLEKKNAADSNQTEQQASDEEANSDGRHQG